VRKIYNVNTILLIAIAVFLLMVIFKNTSNYVVAQGDGNARHVFGVVGTPQGNRQPFFLVDTAEETIIVYEYYQGGGFGLTAVRSYKYDKKLQEHGKAYGLTADEVKAELTKPQTK
jgi:hypothetical protein